MDVAVLQDSTAGNVRSHTENHFPHTFKERYLKVSASRPEDGSFDFLYLTLTY